MLSSVCVKRGRVIKSILLVVSYDLFEQVSLLGIIVLPSTLCHAPEEKVRKCSCSFFPGIICPFLFELCFWSFLVWPQTPSQKYFAWSSILFCSTLITLYLHLCTKSMFTIVSSGCWQLCFLHGSLSICSLLCAAHWSWINMGKCALQT